MEITGVTYMFGLLGGLLFFTIFRKHWLIYIAIIMLCVGIGSMGSLEVGIQLEIVLALIAAWSVLMIMKES